MCKCTPEIRTPFCGKSDCVWPFPTSLSVDQVNRAMASLTDFINELARLGKLSNQELVAECANSDAELEQALRILVRVPAVIHALGNNHTVGCDCPLCVARSLVL